jgi:hypothetical protein
LDFTYISDLIFSRQQPFQGYPDAINTWAPTLNASPDDSATIILETFLYSSSQSRPRFCCVPLSDGLSAGSSISDTSAERRPRVLQPFTASATIRCITRSTTAAATSSFVGSHAMRSPLHLQFHVGVQPSSGVLPHQLSGQIVVDYLRDSG